MKVQLSMSTYNGSTELQALPEGAPVPLAKVQMRKAVLKRQADAMTERIRSLEIQSNMDEARELREERDTLKQQVAALDKIRTAHDRQRYDLYIDNFAS